MHRILFLLTIIFYSDCFSQVTGTKINELKNIEEVQIGTVGGEFINGIPYNTITNVDIDLKNISGNYTNYGGGDFEITHIVKLKNSKFEIIIKDSYIDLNGKSKIQFIKLKILRIENNKLVTNKGIYIFSKVQKGGLDDNKEINGFLIIHNNQGNVTAEFIWKQ